eukprot:NODE_3775_length_635_cov_46.863481_g2716_i0.p5 GENE.NODE_3775_length_635_cov_46.863481_g2716_i0~~NODE_3775_length_635_cov_46.863481_g2716_i0.p5  ORF type:complete len:57 (+),score=32.19 NODE_3775_length_635_cov_46.863481_g2716_i0:29-199(+)
MGKDTMGKIKGEIKQMELEIGVLQHTVLHYKISQAAAMAAKKQAEEDALLDSDDGW